MSLLSVRDLSISFGGLKALDRVSFTAEAGRITALIGPNGAGKTTLVNCVTGMARPDAGRIEFNGRSILGLPSHALSAQGMTRTFQHLRIFGRMSLLENVMVGLHGLERPGFTACMLRLPGVRRREEAMRARASEALHFVGLADRAWQWAGQLPYGDQKRLALARALAAKPRMLLLDEPVAGLNSAETAEMGRLILAVRAQGTGILLIEHDMSLVMRVSDTVAVLCSGALIAQGPPREVKANPEVVHAYLGGGEEFGLHA